MAGYVPGEQPRGGTYIKLNTNENPYPPSPRVLEALRAGLTGDSLRKYPDPHGTAFREAAGRILGVDPASILIGNGSDDILTIVTRTFVPERGRIVSMTPSYLLYRTLSGIEGASFGTVPFGPIWELPNPWPGGKAHLTLLANPNSPSGTLVPFEEMRRWIKQVDGPVVIDEAYVDFADVSAIDLVKLPNVVLTRTFS